MSVITQAAASLCVCSVVCALTSFLVPEGAGKKAFRVLVVLTLTVCAVTPFVTGSEVLEGLGLVNSLESYAGLEEASQAQDERLRRQAQKAVEDAVYQLAAELGINNCRVEAVSESNGDGVINIREVRIYITDTSADALRKLSEELVRQTGIAPVIIEDDVGTE